MSCSRASKVDKLTKLTTSRTTKSVATQIHVTGRVGMRTGNCAFRTRLERTQQQAPAPAATSKTTTPAMMPASAATPSPLWPRVLESTRRLQSPCRVPR